MRIALLEDDIDQGNLLTRWLGDAGHICQHIDSSKTFMQLVKRESFDLLILDWLVPEVSGIEVLSWIRENVDWRIPIVFVTIMDREDDLVKALEQGADDYLIKPVRQRELLARINAVARRSTAVDDTRPVLEMEPFRLDQSNRVVSKNGNPIELTHKEYDLVRFLFTNAGRVLSRGHLLQSVWGRSPDINTRTVDTHISRVRSKLGLSPEQGWCLRSIYQQGYRLERVN